MELVAYKWDEKNQEGHFTYEDSDGVAHREVRSQPLNVIKARKEGRVMKLSSRDKKIIARQLEQAKQRRNKKAA